MSFSFSPAHFASGVLALVKLAALLLIAAGSARAHPPAGPAGIFAIGDVRPVANEVAKFDLDFVSGYTLRASWADLDAWDAATNAPRYDFSRIDQAAEDLRARGKRMTLELFVNKAPAYVLATPGVVTWNNPHPTQGGVQPVPWDATSLAAYSALLQALANHVVAGTAWRFADHPALESVDAPVVGLQGLRELSGTLVAHPGYTREEFLDAVSAAVMASRRAFPDKFGFLAFFSMDDATASPALDEALFARLKTEFNGPGRPTLGFFQETLSDTGPRPDGLGEFLARAAPDTYLLFQALRPWALPDGQTRPPEIASGTPLTGLALAWSGYGCTYAELYGADLLRAENASGLRAWNLFFNAVAQVRAGTLRPALSAEAGGRLRLQWEARPELAYRVLESTDLATWAPVATSETPDGDLSLPAPADGGRRFYRVEIVPPDGVTPP